MYSKFLSIASILVSVSGTAIASEPPSLGQYVTVEELEATSLNVLPNGHGLPKGSGSARTGETIYASQCAACHGTNGVGGPMIPMTGKPQRGTDWSVGTVYEHATSIFDYVRRAMPPYNPKQLSTDEVYSITAYILHLNGLAGIDEKIDQVSLPKKTMPVTAYSRSKWDEDTNK